MSELNQDSGLKVASLNNKLLAGLGILIPIILYISIGAHSKQFLIEVSGLKSETAKFIFSRFLIWSILLATYFYSTIIEKKPFLAWEESKRKLKFYFYTLLLGISLFASTGVLSGWILKLMGAVSKSKVDFSLLFLHHPFLLYLTTITAGICEELIFRGYMLPRFFLITGNKIISIVLVSLLFSSAHYSYGTIAMLIQPFIFGLIFASMYFRFKNIKSLILLHTVWDTVILYIY